MPDPPVIIAPIGDIVSSDLSWPDAEWTPVEGTSNYVLWLSGDGIGTSKLIYSPDDAGCSGGISNCRAE